MATVAAVYTIAPFACKAEDMVPENDSARAGPPRPRPEKKRVWASLEQLDSYAFNLRVHLSQFFMRVDG